jgi:pyruvate dehydrogenase E2 component (dihydrolipoamide acetyltransferase)
MVARKTGGQAARRIKLSDRRKAKATAKRLPYTGHAAVPAIITMQAIMKEVMHRRQTLYVLTGEETPVSAYIVKAAAKALEDHRILDASLKADRAPEQGGTNVAVAINTPDGLVVPAVSETNRKSVLELSREIQQLTDRAMKGGLTVPDSAGGAFAVMNLGEYDIELFSPAIRPPQRAILGFGRTSDRPVAIRKEVRVAAAATLSLAFDGRVVDVVRAAQFLQRVKDLLEDPSKLE